MKTVLLLIGFVLTAIHFAEAQQPAKIPRIGYVSGTGDALNQGPYVAALRQGLRDLGYVEGRNIVIEYRGAEGNTDRFPTLVNELVQTQVDVLIVPTLPAILTAKEATKTIPIVMVSNFDPVATGIVNSLARPGGNITGLATLSQDLSGSGWNCLRRWFRGSCASGLFGIPRAKPQLLFLKSMKSLHAF